MPSTFSPNLRLELIANGEQPGLWGDTTNRNIGTLLEQAIAGVTNIVLANANVTLTTASGATDQARSMILNVTGTATAQRDIICPAVPKVYVVRNATSGGQSILVRTTAGSGVSVANGRASVLFSDGTTMYDASTSLAAGTTLTNPVITGGSATGTALTNCTYSGNVVASNPKFAARSTTDIPINTSTFSTLVFGTEWFDTASAYNSSTGVFTAPVAGTYLFSVALNLVTPSIGSAPIIYASLRQNASTQRFVEMALPLYLGGVYLGRLTMTEMLPLSAGDTVDFTARTNGAGAPMSARGDGNSFSGALLV